ncbi:iron complex outermembrane receptor protein [Chitinophaga niastensis]|uniref:Iron complex outermembrane receptor protein n=1 Tax=Chitinophaga niastensis TaxID=536980 RepID=A0A2P8HD94_CHINA|nr:SusC/RagA family TonB-linked outer membrane protein [Chitinophaga niastensis]PSL44199.1 iron complex outermembrane receptor protein [Chitinophaga niastensis]
MNRKYVSIYLLRCPVKLLIVFQLWLCFVPMALRAQEKYDVHGKVTDEKNTPLPGVSVSEQGSKTGVVTDGEGVYRINVSGKGAQVRVSFMGYNTKVLSINGEHVLNVSLQPQSKQLNDVVITGYGKTSKKNIVGAISSVNAGEFTQGVIGSPSMLLQGKVPGLTITKSGNPNQAPSVILRGPSTLRSGAQEPFYVIDGVPGVSIDLVAPDDIASIDVLKDGASTAIYGARAANGVIMVTTRRPKTDQLYLSYNAYVGAEQVSKRLGMLTGDELRKYLADNGQVLAPANDQKIPGTQQPVNTDWQKEVQRTAISQNHNISLMGNSKGTTYGFSVNYLDNPGIIKGSSMNRLGLRANVGQRVFDDRLRLDFSVFNTTTTQNNVPTDVLYNMLNYLPTVSVTQPDGSFTEDYAGNIRGGSNPVALIANNTDKTKINRMLANGLAEVTILPGLTYTLSLATQREQYNQDIYYNSLSVLAKGNNGRATRKAYTNARNIIESYFNYSKTFGKHNIKLLGGYSWQEDHNGDGFGVTTQGFVSDALSYNNLSLSNPPFGTVVFDNSAQTTLTTLRLISYYARVNYQYADKYYFQASLRNDGSSAFGKNSRWGYFPAASIGWRMTQENFMKSARFLDDLKLRVSYGVSGNSFGFDPLTAQLQYGPVGRYYDNGVLLNSIAPVQNPNPNLKWERTGMFNGGLDFAILKGRISGSVDYYDKQTSDLIWQYPVSTTQFIATTLIANVGKISNKGIEAVINAEPFSGKNFTWRTSVNVAHNTNKVSSLANDQFTLKDIPVAILGGKGQSGNWSQKVIEGQPVGTFTLWHYLGKDKDGISTYQKADGTTTTSPSSADFMIAGNAQPKITYGWNNTFIWKGFDLTLFLRGVSGNKILNATLAAVNTPTDAKVTNVSKFTLQESYNDKNSYLVSDRFLENGSYLRLENLALGYTIKTGNARISKLRVYGNVNNVFTITKYTGIDPEIDLGGLTPGIDVRNYYPKTRSFILGLNASF